MGPYAGAIAVGVGAILIGRWLVRMVRRAMEKKIVLARLGQ